jgi:amidase
VTQPPDGRGVGRWELARLDAVETAARIRSGELSAAEVISAAIERAEALGPVLNAIPARDYERALARAGTPGSGPLAGVPTFIKDLDDVAGIVNSYGSRAHADNVSKQTDRVIARILDTGLVCLGKSMTPEFGLTGTTESAAFGPTRNPWKVTHSPGGSSGGAAALVAAGVVPIAHGSDGGGSIRIPASFCGLVGLKVSRERRFVTAGLDRLPLRVVTYGVVTRTVRDTAHFVTALDQRIASRRLARLPLVEGPGEKRLRVGVFLGAPSGGAVDAEVAATTLAAGRHCAQLGHKVDEILPPFDEQMVEDFLHYWSLLAWGSILQTRLQRRSRFDIEMMEGWTRSLASRFRDDWRGVVPVLRRLRAARGASERLFESYDVLLSPTTTAPAPVIGHLGADVPFETAFQRVRDYFCFTPPQNIIGNTAISLPMGMSSDGLPIGVQFSADQGCESTLLELAYELEADGAFSPQRAPMACAAGEG